jgi:hypothetical protein
MEGDVLRRNPVYLGFRLGYQGKNGQGPFFRPGAYPGVFYQFSYILPGMVVMSTLVMMVIVFMFMVMLRMIVMIMGGGVIIPGNMIRPSLQIDNPMDAGYTAPVFPDEFQRPAFKSQFG